MLKWLGVILSCFKLHISNIEKMFPVGYSPTELKKIGVRVVSVRVAFKTAKRRKFSVGPATTENADAHSKVDKEN